MAILSSGPPSKPVQAHVTIGKNQLCYRAKRVHANRDAATSNNEHLDANYSMLVVNLANTYLKLIL